MTIRLPHWLAGLLLRWRFPLRTIEPSPHESELQRLRTRVQELDRQNKFLLEQSRKIDLLAARAGENTKAAVAKFRLVKSNYVNFKLNTAQLLLYLEQPKIMRALPDFMRADLEHAREILSSDGAFDPNLSRADIALIREGKFKVREMKPLLEIAPDYEAEGAQIILDMLAGPDTVAHNRKTSNNGALTDERTKAQDQTQGTEGRPSPYSEHASEDDGEA